MTKAVKVLVALFVHAGWLPTVVFAIHVFISVVLNAYIVYPPLDIPMHFVGGVAIAYFVAHCFATLPFDVVGPPHRAWAQAWVVITAAATATVLWEFAEFAADRLLNTRSQVSLEDTLADMALGLGGTLVFLAIELSRRRLGLQETLPLASWREKKHPAYEGRG